MKKFKIRTSSGHFFVCKIFASKKLMYDYYVNRCKRWKTEQLSLDFGALVSPYEKRKNGILGENIGEAIFYEAKLGAGLISHEMLHCAMWHERIVADNKMAEFGAHCGDIEERIAYTLTHLVNTFVEKCYKMNIL